jgi:hypothetical protein
MRSPASPFMPDERACSDTNMLGGDTDNILTRLRLRPKIHVGAWKDSACVHEMTMVNQRHEWDPRKAITRP